jgi:hypothetical protein
MSAIQPPYRPILRLTSYDGVQRDISDVVISTSLNYTMDAGTELKIEVVDEGMKMLKAGYFRLGQTYDFTEFTSIPDKYASLDFGTENYTLNSLDVKQGDGTYVNISLGFYDTVFSKMKNDLKPQAYRAANGFLYAQNVAKKYGLKFVGENVKGKQQTVKVKAKNNTESVWAVLQSAANDNQFLCFISNKTLFFCSPKYLIGRWGLDFIYYKPEGQKKEVKFYYVPLVYPTPEAETRYFLTEIPSLRKALDSPKIAEGSATIFGNSSRYLRPGMTVMVYGINFQFNHSYLITSVDYQPDDVEPTQINFANIAKLAPEDKKKVDTKISEVTVISGSGN